jgi:hypothetical protein
MPKQFPCVENTIDIWVKDLHIRMWIDVDAPNRDYQDETRVANDVVGFIHSAHHFDRGLFFSWVSTIPRLNAVQVIYTHEFVSSGRSIVTHGTVAYMVPFEDVHG